MKKEMEKIIKIEKYIKELKNLNSTPYLRFPLNRKDLKITEGWFYSEKERQIHRHKIHAGIDFKAKRGEPVYAACRRLGNKLLP